MGNKKIFDFGSKFENDTEGLDFESKKLKNK